MSERKKREGSLTPVQIHTAQGPLWALKTRSGRLVVLDYALARFGKWARPNHLRKTLARIAGNGAPGIERRAASERLREVLHATGLSWTGAPLAPYAYLVDVDGLRLLRGRTVSTARRDAVDAVIEALEREGQSRTQGKPKQEATAAASADPRPEPRVGVADEADVAAIRQGVEDFVRSSREGRAAPMLLDTPKQDPFADIRAALGLCKEIGRSGVYEAASEALQQAVVQRLAGSPVPVVYPLGCGEADRVQAAPLLEAQPRASTTDNVNYNWSRGYDAAVKAALGQALVRDATFHEDAREATDFVLDRPCKVQARVRRPGFLDQYRYNITIGAEPQYAGCRSEHQKLIDAVEVDYLFYGHASEKDDGTLAHWVLVDLVVLRMWIRRSIEDLRARRASGWAQRHGSRSFFWYDVSLIPDPKLVIAGSDLEGLRARQKKHNDKLTAPRRKVRRTS